RLSAGAREEERGRALRSLEGEATRRPDLERGHRAGALAAVRDGDGRRAGLLGGIGQGRQVRRLVGWPAAPTRGAIAPPSHASGRRGLNVRRAGRISLPSRATLIGPTSRAEI